MSVYTGNVGETGSALDTVTGTKPAPVETGVNVFISGYPVAINYRETGLIEKIVPAIGTVQENFSTSKIVAEHMSAVDTVAPHNSIFVGDVAETLSITDQTSTPVNVNTVPSMFGAITYRPLSNAIEKVVPYGYIFQEAAVYIVTTFAGNVIETGNLSDDVNGIATYFVDVSESGSAVDDVEIYATIHNGSISESGSASDSTNSTVTS